MNQSLPVRTYIGIVPSHSGKVRFASSLQFDPSQRQWISRPMDSHFRSNVETKLLRFISQACGIHNPKGFDVHLLSELPSDHGEGGTASYYTALITAVLVHFGVISKTIIDDWSNHSAAELKNSPGLLFDRVFRLVWQWAILHFVSSSGATPFVSLLPSSVPIIFTSKKLVDQSTMEQLLAKDWTNIFTITMGEKLQYWGSRISEIIDAHSHWPPLLDYGVLNTGESWSIEQNLTRVQELDKEIEVSAEHILRIGRHLLGDVDEILQPRFYKLCQPGQRRERLQQYFLGALTITSFQLVDAFCDMIEKGFSQFGFTRLLERMNRVHVAQETMGMSTPRLRRLSADFRRRN